MSYSRSHMILAFEAASEKNSTASRVPTGQALRTNEGDVLRWRAADAWRNSGLINNALRKMVIGMVGIPRPITANQDAQMWWDRWANSCGYRHNFGSFAQIMGKVAHHLVQDGASYLQRVFTRSTRHENGLLLQVWPDRLRDRGRHQFRHLRGPTPGERDMLDGYEFEDGVLSGVWFQAQTSDPDGELAQSVLVDANDLAVMRYAPTADQIDGLTYFHAAIKTDKQLDDYQKTALLQARIAACLAAIIIAEKPYFAPNNMELGPRIEDASGEPIEHLQPGTFAVAHGTKDVKFTNPDQGAFPLGDFQAMVAAATGLSAETISSKMGEMSFSAARHAVLNDRGTINSLRMFGGMEDALNRIMEWWKEAELLQGRDWRDVDFEWLPTPVEFIQPLEQAKTDEIMVNMGIKSRAEVIKARGRDPFKVREEIRQEREDAEQSDDMEPSADNAARAQLRAIR